MFKIVKTRNLNMFLSKYVHSSSGCILHQIIFFGKTGDCDLVLDEIVL